MLENNSRWPINSFVYLDVDFLRMLVVFKRRDRPLRGYDQVKVSTDRLSCWDHILRPNGDFIQLLLFSETSKKEHSKVSNRFLHPRRSKASINTSSTAATPAAHIIWKTPSRTLSLFSPLVYASLLGHKDQRDQGKRWGGQVGIKGQKKGKRKKKRRAWIESAGTAPWTSALVPSLSSPLPFHMLRLSSLLCSSSLFPGVPQAVICDGFPACSSTHHLPSSYLCWIFLSICKWYNKICDVIHPLSKT